MPRRIHGLGIAALALALCAAPATMAAATHGHRTRPAKHHRRPAKHHRRTVRHPYALRSTNAGDTKRTCVYSAHSIATLAQFDRLVGRDVNCVMVYNDTSTDWSNWERPWFIRQTYDDNNWRVWATAPGKNRQLIISQNLFPASENGVDWRTAGARGDYESHARALAANLVAAGLGNSVIRLAHEANGDWYPDSIGSTDDDYAKWREFWRRTVLAMRSVPGANFSFDWCVNSAYRPIPLAKFYPGDDVVDIVGIDAYDNAVPAGQPRWQTIYNRTDGIGDVVTFARAHGKPLSIPEWGLSPASKSQGGGDDPAYVDGIASVVRNNPVAYQAYFFKYEFATELTGDTASLASYRSHFGSGGDSVAAQAPTTAADPVSAPPAGPTPAGTGAPVHKKKTAKPHHRVARHKRSHRRRRHRHR